MQLQRQHFLLINYFNYFKTPSIGLARIRTQTSCTGDRHWTIWPWERGCTITIIFCHVEINFHYISAHIHLPKVWPRSCGVRLCGLGSSFTTWFSRASWLLLRGPGTRQRGKSTQKQRKASACAERIGGASQGRWETENLNDWTIRTFLIVSLFLEPGKVYRYWSLFSKCKKY